MEIFIPSTINPHAPDELQDIPLNLIEPNEENVRLYLERESLSSLIDLYKSDDPGTVLPDPPVLRYRGPNKLLELLSGERRTTAAHLAGRKSLPCRVVTLSDEEAYKYVLAANMYQDLTTVEIAYRVARMYQLGFTGAEINDLFGGISVSRYNSVGRHINPDLFTDHPKQCDPPITLWAEAAAFGGEWFHHCFVHWDRGLWDEAECERMFRRRGLDKPLDNKQKGLRLSVSSDGRIINVIGKLDLDMYEDHELREVVNRFCTDLQLTVGTGLKDRKIGYGPRFVNNYNPDTLD